MYQRSALIAASYCGSPAALRRSPYALPSAPDVVERYFAAESNELFHDRKGVVVTQRLRGGDGLSESLFPATPFVREVHGLLEPSTTDASTPAGSVSPQPIHNKETANHRFIA